LIYLPDSVIEVTPQTVTVNTTNRKRKSSALSATNVATPAQSKKAFQVTGKLLMQAFSHVKDSVQLLQDKWIIANEWMSILPEHYSSLRGYEDKITQDRSQQL